VPNLDEKKEKREIAKILHDFFGWALTKDRALFENIFAKDNDFFAFYPDSKGTIVGWKQFERALNRWMDPQDKPGRTDIRDLRIVISRTGDVAWFSAVVDDEGEYYDEHWSLRDARWTGVLEKRDGSWKIRQHHMSEANDRISK